MSTAATPLPVGFRHGLGDCVYFALQIPMLRRRGFDVRLACDPRRALLFRAAGATLDDAGDAAPHPWWEPPRPDEGTGEGWWRWHKGFRNFGTPPVPELPRTRATYDEYASERLDLLPYVSPETSARIAEWLRALPTPRVLIHSHGDTLGHRKDMPGSLPADVARHVLELGGSVVFLDWDARMPWFRHTRARHAASDFGPLPLEELVALVSAADLVVGIDSGPAHLARLVGTPSVCCWFGHHPASYALPSPHQLHVWMGGPLTPLDIASRHPLNLADTTEARELCAIVGDVLAPPRFGLDRVGSALLAHFVRKTDGGVQKEPSTHVDRHRSFARILASLPASPLVVETGCIRADEDWAGAGYSTGLLGAYVARRAGRLVSFDVSSRNVAFARARTAELPGVEVRCGDSVAGLAALDAPGADLLFLDSLDAEHPDCARHALRELLAAERLLGPKTLVAVDDTPHDGRGWGGKGALVVPWLLERGWSIRSDGYLVVLGRDA